MAALRLRLLVVIGAALTLVTGCGSGGAGLKGASKHDARASPAAVSAPPGSGSGGQTVPAPAPAGVPADPASVRVIRAWSTALRRGDVRGAARYFALPSQFVNGPDARGELTVIAIRTLGEAEAVNATLPCGAELISADRRGPYVNALFRLTDRPGLGGGCGSGTGQVARANFVIVAGHIRKWIRAPQEPGDNGGGGTTPGPAPPSSPQLSSRAI